MNAQQTDQIPVRRTGTSTSLAAILMMIGLLLSKMTGQLREILIAPVFGFGTISDAYIMGFQIPDLFYQLLVGGAIQGCNNSDTGRGHRETRSSQRLAQCKHLYQYYQRCSSARCSDRRTAGTGLIPLFYGNSDPGTIQLAIQVTRALVSASFIHDDGCTLHWNP